MTEAQRSVMHAAVAAGGASAALMSAAAFNRDDRELSAVAGESLQPLLRAVLHAIAAAGEADGEYERKRLKLAIEDYIDVPTPAAGRCRVCGCTETNDCSVIIMRPGGGNGACAWTDSTRTLCDNPACLERAEELMQ